MEKILRIFDKKKLQIIIELFNIKLQEDTRPI